MTLVTPIVQRWIDDGRPIPTRSVLEAVILDRDPGGITTIEDEGSVEEARQAWRQIRAELKVG